jgi:formate dehydrogenase major subunit
VKPPGLARPDGLIVDQVFRAVRDLVKDSTAPRDEIIKNASWNYTTAEDVLREINGYALRDNPETGLKKGDLVRKVGDLRSDGSTSSGAWIYAGVFAGGENLSKRRDSTTDPGGLGLYPGFGWTWPNNMRILYNRASCDRQGKPYPGSKPIVWWDEQAKRWTGHDVPDVPVLTDGPGTPNGQRAFHQGAEGVGRLFAAVYKDPDPRFTDYWRDVAYVPKDGPLPEMYEPIESPVTNVLHPTMNTNPVVKYPRVPSHQPIGTVDKFPLRADDIDGRGTLVRGFDDAEHSVAQRADPGAGARTARRPRGDAGRGIGGLGPCLVGARRARGEGTRDAAHEGVEDRRPRGHRRVDAVQLGLPGAVDWSKRQPPHN